MKALPKKPAVRCCRPNRRGASLVEFAVVAPVLFMLIFGLIEFGRLVQVQHTLANAAREGARKCSLSTTQNSSDVDTVVRNALSGSFANASTTSAITVSVNGNTTTGTGDLASLKSGDIVTVLVYVDYSNASWLPGNLLGLGTTPTIKAESRMERE